MKTLSKALVGTVAAGAMAVSAATPAFADDYRGRGGIDAGDVIAGALIIGGIAAVASAVGRGGNDGRTYGYGYDPYGRDGDYRYGDYRNGDYRYGDNRYGYGTDPRQAVQQCVRAAERTASRYSYGRADVTDVRDIRQTRYGVEVRGRIAVNQSGRNWRSGDNYYGSGWGGDYRGWSQNLRGYDSGTFKCKFERGRVADLDFSGIRGL